MSGTVEERQEGFVKLLAANLERERNLAQLYRIQNDAESSPDLRRVWDEGWTLKREHEALVSRRLDAASLPSEGEAVPIGSPPRRLALSWFYELEQALTDRYQKAIALAPDVETAGDLGRVVEQQRRWLSRIRSVYSGHSFS